VTAPEQRGPIAVARAADATLVGPVRYLGEAAIEELIRRWRGGASPRDLSAAYGLSVRTVYRYLELAPHDGTGGLAVAVEQPRRRFLEIPLELLDEGTNVRTRTLTRSSSDYGLVASMRTDGVLQPITVVRRGKRYEILYGHRRAAAARAAGLATIPAIVETDPADKGVRQLVENEHRRRVDPIGIARALREHLDANPRTTQAELAARIGRPTSWVNRHLALLLLDEATQGRVATGAIGVGSAVRHRHPEARVGRPRVLQTTDEGRSRSVTVPLRTGGGGSNAKATIGLELGEGTVEVLLEDGTGHGVMVTLDIRSAQLLGRRLRQAGDAAAAALAAEAVAS
jgi:ParB/RepB/Spo0J family partition protein